MIYAIKSYDIYPECDDPVWLCREPSEDDEENYIWVKEDEFLEHLDRDLENIGKFLFNSVEEARELANEIGIVDDFEIVAIE